MNSEYVRTSVLWNLDFLAKTVAFAPGTRAADAYCIGVVVGDLMAQARIAIHIGDYDLAAKVNEIARAVGFMFSTPTLWMEAV